MKVLRVVGMMMAEEELERQRERQKGKGSGKGLVSDV